MTTARLVKLLLILALVGVGGYMSRTLWLPHADNVEKTQTIAAKEEKDSQSDKIIVGDKAQKNLGLTAKPLKADVFWKTITVQGMVVDRPGVSDREVVSPTVGVVDKISHTPGDIVPPGDVLFMLRLTSESLHQAQTELYKATQDIQLAKAKYDRLASAGDAIAGARLIEVETELKRLEVTVESSHNELLSRGLSSDDIEMIAKGKFIREIPVLVPSSTASTTYELQELKIGVGEQVQAGEPLCRLSDHKWLNIEGRAFRDETVLLERSIKDGLPVEVDFQEAAGTDWPPIDQTFRIQYVANTIDPMTRTFAFLIPLENQSKSITRAEKPRLLWRFRPGQKVLLHVRVEKLDNVFVLPADAIVREGADAFVFTQNVNTFERKPVHVLYQDRDEVVIANDGSLPTYLKNKQRWTVAAVVRNAAPQLNRMAKAGSTATPKGFHIHADGSLHKNEDEDK